MGDSSKTKEMACFCCNRKGQFIAKFSVRADVVCQTCGKKGHLERPCNRSKIMTGTQEAEEGQENRAGNS